MTTQAAPLTAPSPFTFATQLGEVIFGAGTLSRLPGAFTDARMHVPIETARAARTLARELRADCTVAFGRGAPANYQEGRQL